MQGAAMAIKVVRVVLEYGMLLWLIYFTVSLSRRMFGEVKQELKQQMHEMVKDNSEITTEEMEDLLDAANKMLDAKGIAPMTFGPLTRRKIMMMREQESATSH